MFFIGAPPLLIDSNGKQQRLPRTCILNLRTRSARFETESPLKLVSIRVRTGLLGALSKIPPVEHADACVSADVLFGSSVTAVSERIATLSLRPALAVVHEFAHSLAIQAHLPEPYVRQAASRLYYGSARVRIAPLAEELGVTCRHLERRFLVTTGLAPKTYQRIARLHHTVRALLLEHRSNYLATALAHGFCDQAHFIHELRALSGLKPTDLLTESEFRSHFYNPPSGLDVILQRHDDLEGTHRYPSCNSSRQTGV